MATAVIIVSYKTPGDIADCLHAVDRLQDANAVGVFIVENGGADAYESSVKAISALCGAAGETGEAPRGPRHMRRRAFKLPFSGAPVVVAEANDNLGYAGGVNSWLEWLVGDRRWDGFWVLNPDTAPEPTALATLIAACRRTGKGMAGSVVVPYDQRDLIAARGLQWRPWRAGCIAVDQGRALSSSPARAEIDAPCGTSVYVTRPCLDEIGFMNEEYFLYFEDLDWGLRAKAAGLLCAADDSLVPHKYGASIGSAVRRADRSRLAVYLDARNSILFTKLYDARLMAWAILQAMLKVLLFCAVGAPRNGYAALSGLAAGVKGETGRPAWHK